MRRTVCTFFALAFGLAAFASPARAAFGLEDFGLNFAADGGSAVVAGSHPAGVVVNLRLNTTGDPEHPPGVVPDGALRDLELELPPGLVGRPAAVPQCSEADFRAVSGSPPYPACLDSTGIGTAVIEGREAGGSPYYLSQPIYNLPPGPGSVQKIGFYVRGLEPVVVQFYLSSAYPYRLVAKVTNAPQLIPIYAAKLTLWGNPGDAIHDDERPHCIASFREDFEEELQTIAGCNLTAGFPAIPYITLPTACSSVLTTTYRVSSWEGASASGQAETAPPVGCNQLNFSPGIEADPTTTVEQASTGLEVSLNAADEGFQNPRGQVQSTIRRVEMTLPEGMTVNPSVATGLGSCSQADFDRESIDSGSAQGCPEDSKIGTVEVETPLLQETLEGNVFIAKPYENEPGSQLAVYVVIRSPTSGVLIKQTMELVPNGQTGRLTVIANNLSQVPFSHFRVNFRGGERGPLTTPGGCGSYEVKTNLTPWSSEPPIVSTSSFSITSAPGGGGCDAIPFAPRFEAGTTPALAGAYSPFVMNLTRAQGSPQLSSIAATLPRGLMARLAGVSECPEGSIAEARTRGGPNQGAQELTDPSCPAGSEIGSVVVGAGSGSLTYADGTVYLSGPYKGAPLSMVMLLPVVAGPFDLGSAVVRDALYVDPITAQIRVVSDQLPTILQGIPLDIRSISIDLDRQGLTVNPTSCNPMAVLGSIGAITGQAALPQSRFQVYGCKGLRFRPKLALSFSGAPTRRGGHPKLRAVLVTRAGEANLRRIAVTLPRTEFLENSHIRDICTQAQFASETCPKRSIYGYAKAWSPLLGAPLRGPVYLRSSDHRLPDLVAALHGRFDIDIEGRIDSIHSRVRTTFETVPDVSVTKFELTMQGGGKGLVVNDTQLCRAKPRTAVESTGQNGATERTDPLVKIAGCRAKGRRQRN